MNTCTRQIGLSVGAALSAAASASAQLSINWCTIDGGGGTSAGGVYTLSGTIAQPDAGTLGNASLQCNGGYWSVPLQPSCYADCDQSGSLNVNDFVCFQSRFAGANSYADCDQSGTLNVNDFVCFQARFAAGCP
jgi:hypothetical protein